MDSGPDPRRGVQLKPRMDWLDMSQMNGPEDPRMVSSPETSKPKIFNSISDASLDVSGPVVIKSLPSYVKNVEKLDFDNTHVVALFKILIIRVICDSKSPPTLYHQRSAVLIRVLYQIWSVSPFFHSNNETASAYRPHVSQVWIRQYCPQSRQMHVVSSAVWTALAFPIWACGQTRFDAGVWNIAQRKNCQRNIPYWMPNCSYAVSPTCYSLGINAAFRYSGLIIDQFRHWER